MWPNTRRCVRKLLNRAVYPFPRIGQFAYIRPITIDGGLNIRCFSSSRDGSHEFKTISSPDPAIRLVYDVQVPRKEIQYEFVDRYDNIVDMENTPMDSGISILLSFDLEGAAWLPKPCKARYKELFPSEYYPSRSSWGLRVPLDPSLESPAEGLEQAFAELQENINVCCVIPKEVKRTNKDPDPNEQRLKEKKMKSERKRSRMEGKNSNEDDEAMAEWTKFVEDEKEWEDIPEGDSSDVEELLNEPENSPYFRTDEEYKDFLERLHAEDKDDKFEEFQENFVNGRERDDSDLSDDDEDWKPVEKKK